MAAGRSGSLPEPAARAGRRRGEGDVQRVPHDGRRERARAPRARVERRSAAHERERAAAHEGLHAAVRRHARRGRGGGAAPLVGGGRRGSRVEGRADRSADPRLAGGGAAMNVFPWALGGPLALYLGLYVIPLAIHPIFVRYVLAGTGWG